MNLHRGTDAALDKHAHDARMLDPRFHAAADNPDCFLCGKVVHPGTGNGVETDCSARLHAHQYCMANTDPIDIMARYWMAIRAGVKGVYESPNPGVPIVHGRFM